MATLQADLAAVKVWVAAEWAKVQTYYKQLIAAVAVGHYSGLVETVVAWVHKVL